MFLISLLFFPFTVADIPVHPIFLENSTYNKLLSPYDALRYNVTVFLKPHHIVLVSLNENNQAATYLVFMNYSWIDPRLAYDPVHLSTSYIVIPNNLIWLPWINCWNCAYVTNFEHNKEYGDTEIAPDGRVSASIRTRLDTICQCDLTAFPFDVQFCSIYLDGGLTLEDKQHFDPVFNQDPSTIWGTAEWSISYYSTLIGPAVTGLKVTYKLIRKPQFYVTFLILPAFIITSSCLACLTLPSSLGPSEKVNLGITGLLGQTFLLSLIVQEVPRTDKLPIIGLWILIQMIFCILAMAAIYIVEKIKQRITKKGFLLHYGVDICAFVVIVGANFLCSLFMYLYPGELTEDPHPEF